MTAEIFNFPPPPIPMTPIDLWLDEVDDLGPFPSPIHAGFLLDRCPEPGHEVAIWLAKFDTRVSLDTAI